MWKFTIKQDGLNVSSGVGENKEDCIGEAFHYLCLYAEETFKKMTMEIKTNGGVKMTEEDFGMFFDIGDDGYASILEDRVETLQKKLDIATKALEKYQKAIKEFKKDRMNNLVMLSHQVIYDIDRDIQQALKEMEEV